MAGRWPEAEMSWFGAWPEMSDESGVSSWGPFGSKVDDRVALDFVGAVRYPAVRVLTPGFFHVFYRHLS